MLDVASGKSIWRGLEYFEEKKVISWEQTGPSTYQGKVSGSGKQIYDVYIDKAHPRKSKCNCPFADGRMVVCKHMIALLFTVEPKVAEDFLREVEEYEAEEEARVQQHYEELRDYVYSLSKAELQRLYLDVLIEREMEEDGYW